MQPSTYVRTWKTWLAFAIIYFVWGGTFLAVRIGVREVPPLLLAAIRFLIAGGVLFLWVVLRGERAPSARQWGSILLLSFLIFVMDYGCLFWAEQRVPSGLASVMLSTIPAFIAVFEIVFLRTQKLTIRLGLALLSGIGGVAVLVNRSASFGGVPVDGLGAFALVIGAMSWSAASVLIRKLPLPSSQVMSAGAQMLVGGLMLTVAAGGFDEFQKFHPQTVSPAAWLSLAYLTILGSLIAFTAYVWLIHHESPTKVGTYAYVNPVIAVFLGYFAAGEPLGLRTILGTMLVLASVIVITTARTKKLEAVIVVEEAS